MASGNPPQDKIGTMEFLEPFVLATVKPPVHGPPNEPLQRFNILPYGHIDQHGRIRKWPGAGRISAVILITPNKPRAALRKFIDECKIIHEVRHAGIINGEADSPDVELCNVLV